MSSAFSGPTERARKLLSGLSYFSTSIAKAALSPAAERRDNAKSSSFGPVTTPCPLDRLEPEPQRPADQQWKQGGSDCHPDVLPIVGCDQRGQRHRDPDCDQYQRQPVIAVPFAAVRDLFEQFF